MWNMIPTQGGTDKQLHDEGEKILVKTSLIVEALNGEVSVRCEHHPYSTPIDITIISELHVMIGNFFMERFGAKQKESVTIDVDQVKNTNLIDI